MARHEHLDLEERRMQREWHGRNEVDREPLSPRSDEDAENGREVTPSTDAPTTPAPIGNELVTQRRTGSISGRERVSEDRYNGFPRLATTPAPTDAEFVVEAVPQTSSTMGEGGQQIAAAKNGGATIAQLSQAPSA